LQRADSLRNGLAEVSRPLRIQPNFFEPIEPRRELLTQTVKDGLRGGRPDSVSFGESYKIPTLEIAIATVEGQSHGLIAIRQGCEQIVCGREPTISLRSD
jgi:hypothetical protein